MDAREAASVCGSESARPGASETPGDHCPGSIATPKDVFCTGHVQLAIGNNQVVEAPHAGATDRISQLGTNVQIRRPR
jgi:hypothetical protein